MSKGAPALNRVNRVIPAPPPGPPFAANSADNGLSVDPVSKHIVFGVSDGSPSTAADLLDARKINMHDNYILFNTDDGNSATVFQLNGPSWTIFNDLPHSPAPAPAVGYQLMNFGAPSMRAAFNMLINGQVQFKSFDNQGVPTGNGFFQWIIGTTGGGDIEFMRLNANGSLMLGGPVGADNGRTLQVGGNVSIATDFTIVGLDFPNTPAQTSSDLSSALAIGSLPGDVVMLGVDPGSVMPNSMFTAWISAADTVTVRFNNYSAAAQNPPAGNFKVSVIKMT